MFEMQEILTQFAIAFQPWMIWVCLLGVTLGILWGAIAVYSTLAWGLHYAVRR